MTLQEQIDLAQTDLAPHIIVPKGINVMTKPWNLRNKTHLHIRGEPGATVVWHFDPLSPAEAPTVCMDTIGTRNILIENVDFGLGNKSKRPHALWIHGRPQDGKTQRRLNVRNVSFMGWFTKATVAFVTVENELCESVDFENGVPNTTALFLSRKNSLGITSPFGEVFTGATWTSTNHLYSNCSFNHEGHVGMVNPANNNDAYGLTLFEGVHDLLIQGGSTSGGYRGGVLRIAGADNRRLAVVAPNWESKNAKACIVVDGDAYGFSVRDGLLMATGPAVQLNGTAENMVLNPAEMLCSSVLKLGPLGKLMGLGL